LGLFPTSSGNMILTQWAQYGNLSSLYGNIDLTYGWWRHTKTSITLWVGGNVSAMKYLPRSSGVGYDYRFYTGERPLSPPNF
jgi:hypothetical protein